MKETWIKGLVKKWFYPYEVECLRASFENREQIVPHLIEAQRDLIVAFEKRAHNDRALIGALKTQKGVRDKMFVRHGQSITRLRRETSILKAIIGDLISIAREAVDFVDEDEYVRVMGAALAAVSPSKSEKEEGE